MYKETKPLNESEAPTNVVGSGSIAGSSAENQPGVHIKQKQLADVLKRSLFKRRAL